MKNLDQISKDCRKTFNLLNSLSKEVGAYGILPSWSYEEKLELQCDRKKLQIWIEENNLKFNTLHHGEPAYETEDFILFAYK
ncbi:hypothetical protein [Clostridium cadaveris]